MVYSFSSEAMTRLSPYAESLTSTTKERYKEKISLIGGLDPFLGREQLNTWTMVQSLKDG